MKSEWYLTISNLKTNQPKERVGPTPAGSSHECQIPGFISVLNSVHIAYIVT